MIMYLIFDFDGVLCNGLESDIRADFDDNPQLDRDSIIDNFFQYFEKPTHSNNCNLTKSQVTTKLNHQQKISQFRLNYGKNPINKKFIDSVVKIPNVKLAIVSSSCESFLIPTLSEYAQYFEFIFGFETSHSKEQKIQMICDSWQVQPTQTYYFTDTTTDILELQDFVGIDRIIGCSWGYQGYSKLKKHLPDNQILLNSSSVHLISHMF